MIEANPETLTEILKQRNVNINSSLLNNSSNNMTTEVLKSPDLIKPEMPLHNGTNFLNDLTNLIKAGGELLNTEFGKVILKRLNPPEENNETQAISSPPQQQQTPAITEQSKQNKLNAEEIYLFSYSLIENVIKSKEDITGKDILTALTEQKEILIKKLDEVFNNDNKQYNEMVKQKE